MKELRLSSGEAILIRPAFPRDLLAAEKIVGPKPEQIAVGISLCSICATPKAGSMSFENWLDVALDDIRRVLSEILSPRDLTVAAAMLGSSSGRLIISTELPEFPAPMLVKRTLPSGRLVAIRKFTVAEMLGAGAFDGTLCEKHFACTAAICQLAGEPLTYDQVLHLEFRDLIEIELLKRCAFAAVPPGISDVFLDLHRIGFSEAEAAAMYIDEAAQWLSGAAREV